MERNKADDRAKESAISARVKIGLTIAAMLVAAVVYIVTNIGMADREPQSDVRALTVTVDKLNRALDKMMDRPEPRGVSRGPTTADTGGGS